MYFVFNILRAALSRPTALSPAEQDALPNSWQAADYAR